MKNLFILVFLLYSFQVFSTEITISAKGYSGKTFEIKSLDNFLASSNVTIQEITIPENGKISFSIESTAPKNIHFNFDIYQAWFIAEPNKTYHFELPPPTNAYTNSPYFEVTNFHLVSTIPDTLGLNYQVEKFLSVYNQELDKNASKIIYGRNSTTALLTIASIESQFNDIPNQYFEEFRQSHYATIELLAQPRTKNQLIAKYIKDRTPAYNQPEYANLFLQLFSEYFSQFNGSKKAIDIAVSLNYGKLNAVLEFIEKESNVSQQLSEAILLSNLETIFFSRQYNPNGILKIAQEIEASSRIDEHKTAATQLMKRVQLHLPGVQAPDLNITDLEGNNYDWNSFYFKYVYLYFANSDTATFHRNILYLDRISKAFPHDLEIAIVLPEKSLQALAAIEPDITNRFTLLKANDKDAIYERFDVTRYPNFYLIDLKGNIAWFQTPWPEEKFSEKFHQLISGR